MITWGVVATTTADARGVGRHRDLLERHLDGVVEVEVAVQPGRAAAASGHLDPLLSGLRSVPQDVDLIVYADGGSLDACGIERLLEMLSGIGDAHGAVVRGRPVTDALKLVAGRRMIGSVDRTGLDVPRLPVVVRRSALQSALLLDPRPTAHDLPALLLAAGSAVKMVRDGAPPLVLSPPLTLTRPAVARDPAAPDPAARVRP